MCGRCLVLSYVEKIPEKLNDPSEEIQNGIQDAFGGFFRVGWWCFLFGAAKAYKRAVEGVGAEAKCTVTLLRIRVADRFSVRIKMCGNISMLS